MKHTRYAPEGDFGGRFHRLPVKMASYLSVGNLNIDQAAEIAALFDDKRIDYDDDGTLTIYGVPSGASEWLSSWIVERWPEKGE